MDVVQLLDGRLPPGFPDSAPGPSWSLGSVRILCCNSDCNYGYQREVGDGANTLLLSILVLLQLQRVEAIDKGTKDNSPAMPHVSLNGPRQGTKVQPSCDLMIFPTSWKAQTPRTRHGQGGAQTLNRRGEGSLPAGSSQA